jgi:nitrous oxidase accessory protein NosD
MGKILFLPVSIVSGLIAGQIGKRLFTLIWGVIDDEEAPKAHHREVNYIKLGAALLLEGAVFALIRGFVDHGARQGYARLTGSWPGEEKPEEK